jgi:Gly-Xaa carboxypeptidase
MGNEREKTDPLPVPVTGAVEERRPPSRKSKWRVLAFISLLAIAMTLRYTGYGGASMSKIQPGHYDANVCPQSNALYPNRYAQLWESLGNEYDQDEFNERATEWLQGAVRIPYVIPALAVLSSSETLHAE